MQHNKDKYTLKSTLLALFLLCKMCELKKAYVCFLRERLFPDEGIVCVFHRRSSSLLWKLSSGKCTRNVLQPQQNESRQSHACGQNSFLLWMLHTQEQIKDGQRSGEGEKEGVKEGEKRGGEGHVERKRERKIHDY